MRHSLPLVLTLFLASLLTACGGGGGGGDGDDGGDASPFAFVVDADNGDDNNRGTSDEPFKTITRAMLVAQDGDVVRVRKGLYIDTMGEKFPIVVPTGVTLLGDFNRLQVGSDVRIFGNGETSNARLPGRTILATIVPQERAVLAGLTIQNFGQHDAPGTLDVVVVAAAPAVVIRNCVIEAGLDYGISFLPDSEAMRIEHCRIEQCGTGMVFIGGGGEGSAIENTTVTDNQIGVSYLFGYGADLGGGSAGSQGNNRFFGNSRVDLYVTPGVDVAARNNLWDGFPEPSRANGGVVTGGIDIWAVESQSVVDVDGARSVNPPLYPGS